uniref:Uncharacterized protein n=1 Tax=Cacopsylla melanoneura TaxID=428564 RepID=A0A8D8XYE3_9HEMI
MSFHINKCKNMLGCMLMSVPMKFKILHFIGVYNFITNRYPTYKEGKKMVYFLFKNHSKVFFSIPIEFVSGSAAVSGKICSKGKICFEVSGKIYALSSRYLT